MSATRANAIIGPHLVLLLVALIPIFVLIIGGPLTPWQEQPIFESKLLVALAALSLTALLMLGPMFRPISSMQRLVLTALRLTVVVLLVAFMMRPTCVTETIRRQSASLVVLMDASRSMTLPSATEANASRWQAQRDALVAAEEPLAALARDIDVKIYMYDRGVREVELKDGKIQFPAAPTGDQTDIGTSLYEAAVRRERGTRVAAVILLGDGTQTAFDPQVEMFQAARELDRGGTALYAAAFGIDSDVAQSRDVEVEYLPDQYSVFAKNELTVKAVVRVRLFANAEIPVELIVEDEDGNQQTVGRQTKTAQQNDQPLDYEFKYTPEKAGQYKLTVRAAEIPQERVTKNNELSAFLTVFEGGLRVYYLYGGLTFEQKFLRQSLATSEDIDVVDQYVDPRLRDDRWPESLADYLRRENFDVYILGDVDADALWKQGVEEETLRTLVDEIENKGKGLIMLGGYHSFGPGGYADTPLASVLPITMDPLRRQQFGAKIREEVQLPATKIIPTGKHYLTQLAPGAENDVVWRSLPPLLGANKFAGVKPSARILAESESRAPLLVEQSYGDGRVLAFAGDSTWQWWMLGHEDEHRRFWRQIALWLAKRDDLVQDHVWLKLAQRRFNPGARVDFRGGAKTASGAVIPDARFTAMLEMPDGTKQNLELGRDGDEVLSRIEDTAKPGIYRLELVASNAERKLGSARATFEVFDRDIELASSAANPGQLRRLAEQTSDHRGRAVTPEELPAVLQEVRANLPPLELPIREEHQLFDYWQAAWGMFLLVALLLCAEWILRKRWQLV